jgi:hypothetical protein
VTDVSIQLTATAMPVTATTLDVDWHELTFAAIVVGKNGWRDLRRFGIANTYDARWRLAFLSSVVQQAADRRLYRTELYRDGLDPTEKGFTSYLLAMTSTMAFARALLDVPWLVHVDRLLLDRGLPCSGTRPDLVGMRWDGQPVVAEAKGRTNGRSTRAIAVGKRQLGASRYRFESLNGPAALAFVSHSYFDDERLSLHVEDPPARGETLAISEVEMCGAFLATVGEVVTEHDQVEVTDRYDVASIGDTGVLVGLHQDLRPALEQAEQPQTTPPSRRPRKPRATTTGPASLQRQVEGFESQMARGRFAELGKRTIEIATRLEGSRQLTLPDQPQLDARVRDGVFLAVDRRVWPSTAEFQPSSPGG